MDEAGVQASLEVLKQGVPSQVAHPKHHKKRDAQKVCQQV